MEGPEQMDIEGNQQMDMDNDDDGHETENDGVDATNRHKTDDSTV
jgi:hypothetical protein